MRVDLHGAAAAAIATLGIAALVAGLVLSGGPLQGRKERRDADRSRDLAQLSMQVRCLADAADGVLPEAIVSSESCPADLRLNDPFTGAPYRYGVIGARSYRLCADFELPLDTRRWPWGGAQPDAAAGCLVWHLAVRGGAGVHQGTGR